MSMTNSNSDNIITAASIVYVATIVLVKATEDRQCYHDSTIHGMHV